MSIQFQCPLCGNQSSLSDQYAGQTGPCKQCGQTITIPEVAGVDPTQGHAGQAGQAPYYPAFHGNVCPKCNSTSVSAGPWPWYLGTIGAIFVKAVCCQQCGHNFDARKPQADLGKRKLVLALVINGIGGLGILAVIGGLALMIMNMGP